MSQRSSLLLMTVLLTACVGPAGPAPVQEPAVGEDLAADLATTTQVRVWARG